jgi:hypothetical protein
MRTIPRVIGTFLCLAVGCLALGYLALGPAAPTGRADDEARKEEGAPGAKKPLFEKSDRLGPTDPFDTLPTRKYRKVFEQKMVADRPYAIDVTSRVFPAVVRVEDLAGRTVAPSAGGPMVSPVGIPDTTSRLLFVPRKTAAYRIIVTSRFNDSIGPFTLQVMEPDGKVVERAGALSPDGPVDRASTERFCKRYPYKMSKDELYVINLESLAFDTQVRVEAPNGAEVASGRGLGGARRARLTFLPPRSDTYTIVATSNLTRMIGPFTLTVLRPGSKEGAEGLDVDVALEPSDPVDRVLTRSHRKVLEQVLDARHTYVIDLSSTAFEPYLRLEDLAGTPLAHNGGTASARLVFTPAKTGPYRIIATSRGPDKVGPFKLEVRTTDNRKGAARRIAGRIESTDPFLRAPTSKFAKRFERKMVAGRPLVIDVRARGMAPRLFVEDAAGQFVARSDGRPGDTAAHLLFTPSATGAYKVVVTSAADDRTGPFTLNVRAPGPKGGLRKEVADQLDGKCPRDTVPTHRHYKSYSVGLTYEKLYDIEMTSPEFPALLYVQGADGQVLAQDTNGGEGNEARLQFSPPATGKYTVIASSALARQTGPFSVRVAAVAPEKPALLRKEDKLTGSDPLYAVPTKNYRQAYDFKLEANQAYLFKMASKGLAPYLRLEGGERTVLGEASGTASAPAVLLFNCKRAGSYRVIASSAHANQTGPFVLTAEQLETDFTKDGELALTDPRLTLPTPWRRKDLTQRFEAGKNYLVQLEGPAAGAVVRLPGATPPDQLPVSSADSSRAVFTPASTGEHRLTVLSKGAGPFTVTVRPLLAATSQASALEGSDPRDVQPTLRHQKTLTHRLEAKQPYVLRASSKAFAPVVRVVDAKGNVLARSEPTPAGALAVFTPTVSGPHSLITMSHVPGQTGPFHIKLQPLVRGLSAADRLTFDDDLDTLPTGLVCKNYEERLAPGRFYLMELRSNAFPTRLRLSDRRGRTVAQDRLISGEGPGKLPYSQLTYLPSEAGTYRITATASAPRRFGPFALTLQPFSATSTRAGQLTRTDDREREPTSRYAKVYRLEMKQGEPNVIVMASKVMDPVIRIEDQGGNELQREDRGARGVTERMLFFPPRTEEYRIIATTYGARETGPFTLKVVAPNTVASAAGKLTNTDFFDPLQNLSYQKVHTFKMKRGELYLISLESKAFLPFVRLESSRGQHLRRGPDRSVGGVAHISFVAPVDDTYRVIATSVFGGATGDYRVLIRQTE